MKEGQTTAAIITSFILPASTYTNTLLIYYLMKRLDDDFERDHGHVSAELMDKVKLLYNQRNAYSKSDRFIKFDFTTMKFLNSRRQYVVYMLRTTSISSSHVLIVSLP